MTTSDAPQPPGGPLRQDAPDGPLAPGGDSDGNARPDQDPPVSAGGPDGSDGGTGGGPDPEVTKEPTQDEGGRDLQEENAETSLDQPST